MAEEFSCGDLAFSQSLSKCVPLEKSDCAKNMLETWKWLQQLLMHLLLQTLKWVPQQFHQQRIWKCRPQQFYQLLQTWKWHLQQFHLLLQTRKLLSQQRNQMLQTCTTLDITTLDIYNILNFSLLSTSLPSSNHPR